MHEVAVSGENGFRLVLRVSNYESPELMTESDAPYLTVNADAAMASHGFSAEREYVSLFVSELESFRDGVRRLVEELEGEATLSPLENEVGCTIKLEHGRGEIDAFIRQPYPETELRVQGVPTDQSYLRETVRQLDALLKTIH